MTDQSDFDPERPPIRGWLGNNPVVDINGVPEEHWLTVMERFHPSTYGMVHAGFTGSLEAVGRLGVALGEARLNYSDGRVRVPADAVANPPGLPTPHLEPPDHRQRQVNFRLKADHYKALARAAELLNMRPTRLASLLVIRGVDQILREARSG